MIAYIISAKNNIYLFHSEKREFIICFFQEMYLNFYIKKKEKTSGGIHETLPNSKFDPKR